MCAKKLDTHIRKEQIVKAALGIIQNQGIKYMTIERISKVVGIVPSAIYRHFRNKDEVFDAVFYLIQTELLKNVKNAKKDGGTHLEILRRLLMIQAQVIQDFPAILPRLVFSDLVLTGHLERKKKVYLILRSFLSAIAQIFKDGQMAGEIRSDIPSESLAVQFFGLFQPAAFLYQLSDGDYDIAKQSDIAWRLFITNLQVK